ncbi:MAG: DUF1947 domain-containing protein [Desulfurococcales archaeon]|nr:DUF1947 domain-containing protein [Desulfurococcales archaeon]
MARDKETPKPSKRYAASKKERKSIIRYLSQTLGLEASDSLIEHVEFKDILIYVVDGLPCVVEREGARFPHLLCLIQRRATGILPRVVVDRGATSAVGRGADLMIPGIRRVEGTFSKGDIVVIADEETNMPVAIGKALMASDEIEEKLRGVRKGKAIEVIHRPGDVLWRLGKAL